MRFFLGHPLYQNSWLITDYISSHVQTEPVHSWLWLLPWTKYKGCRFCLLAPIGFEYYIILLFSKEQTHKTSANHCCRNLRSFVKIFIPHSLFSSKYRVLGENYLLIVWVRKQPLAWDRFFFLMLNCDILSVSAYFSCLPFSTIF